LSPPAGTAAAHPDAAAWWVVHDACEFLRKRRLDVPQALRAATATAAPGNGVRSPPPATPRRGGGGCGGGGGGGGAGQGGGAAPSDLAVAERLRWVHGQLGGLKERQRRALTRYVEQQRRRRLAPPPQVVPHSESDDEASSEGDHSPPTVRGGRWPDAVVYRRRLQILPR
jgi:hypothetical protein